MNERGADWFELRPNSPQISFIEDCVKIECVRDHHASQPGSRDI